MKGCADALTGSDWQDGSLCSIHFQGTPGCTSCGDKNIFSKTAFRKSSGSYGLFYTTFTFIISMS